jgi:hypothetical protein
MNASLSVCLPAYLPVCLLWPARLYVYLIPVEVESSRVNGKCLSVKQECKQASKADWLAGWLAVLLTCRPRASSGAYKKYEVRGTYEV